MAQKPETVFRQNTVIPDLRMLPNTAFFPIQQKTIKGDPDFLVCINGLFVAIELKSDKGQLSKLQEYKMNYILRARGITFVVTPGSWTKAYNILRQLAYDGEPVGNMQ